MTVIERANARAQRRLRQMVDAHTYANPDDRHTRLYVQAERLLDALTGETRAFDLGAAHDAADWRLAAMTGDYAAGVALPDVPLADLGNHFAGMPS